MVYAAVMDDDTPAQDVSPRTVPNARRRLAVGLAIGTVCALAIMAALSSGSSPLAVGIGKTIQQEEVLLSNGSFPLSASISNMIQKEEVHWSSSCRSIDDSNIEKMGQLCCHMSFFVHHCATGIELNDGNRAIVEWVGDVQCNTKSAWGKGPGCYDDFWVHSEFRKAKSGHTYSLADVKDYAKKNDFTNCQYFSRDAVYHFTGFYDSLGQGVLTSIFSR